MKKLLRGTLIGVVVLALLAIAVPFLLPLERFIPEVARAASDTLGQPVAIDDLKLHLVPTPRLVAAGITVGRNAEVTLGELEIVPDLASLVSGPPTLRLVRANRVDIREGALRIPRGIAKRDTDKAVPVSRVVLVGVRVHHVAFTPPIFDLDVRLADGLRLKQARAQTRDGTLVLHVEPLPDGTMALGLTGRTWMLPVGPPIVFDTLMAHGTLIGAQLEIPKIEAKFYGGAVTASARADWAKDVAISGEAHLADVDLVPLQRALGKPAKLSGRLRAEATFGTRAASAKLLGDALALEGPFEVVGGAYQGVDLSKAAESAGNTAHDDATPFQELKGKLRLRGKQVKLEELCMRSPKLVAGGTVEIAPDQSLSGKLDMSVAQTGGLVGMPVTVGGSTENPTFRPTKGYLIGAAIGTVILPGIGTSIGSSVASKMEGISGCK